MKYPSDSNHFQRKYAPKPDLKEARKKKREEYNATSATVKAREVAAEEYPRINKQFYAEIAAEMEAIAKKAELSDDPNVTGPTIQDEILAMSKKGNELYVKNWKGYKKGALEKPFPANRLTHEITHVSARIPHSIQGEMTGLAFEGGLGFGLALRQLNDEGIKKFQEGARADYDHYVTEQEKTEDFPNAMDHDFFHEEHPKKHYEENPAKHASKRDWAIHLAEGMYLREKMDRIVIEALPNTPKGETPRQRYARLKKFSDDYSQRDHQPDYNYSTNEKLHASKQLDFKEDFTMLDDQNEVMFQCMHVPNAVVHLSEEERRAIKAVALGIAEPKDTPYPQRMNAIKEALVHVGMFFDQKEYAAQPEIREAVEAEETKFIQKNQHASVEAVLSGDDLDIKYLPARQAARRGEEKESPDDYAAWKKFQKSRDAIKLSGPSEQGARQGTQKKSPENHASWKKFTAELETEKAQQNAEERGF